MSKKMGQIFTPKPIVQKILNDAGYKGKKILNSKVLEPSFGDGAFLFEIIERCIYEAKNKNLTDAEIANLLEKNIYGIELDDTLFESTKSSIYNFIKAKLPTTPLPNLSLYSQDALTFEGEEFDFIVGNPPYVKTKNMDKFPKSLFSSFSFSTGNTDLYVLFFEKCLSLLNEKGTLAFITPNGYLSNISQKKFRRYLIDNRLWKQVTNYKNTQIFPQASTYTAISILSKDNEREGVIYEEMDEEIEIISYEEISKPGFLWVHKNDREFVKRIERREEKISDFAKVQYAAVTNRDAIFIGVKEPTRDSTYCLFNGVEVEVDSLHKVADKIAPDGSCECLWAIFPYVEREGIFVALEEPVFKDRFPKAYNYLLSHRESLERRDMDKGLYWYEFGRRQGLRNGKYKLFIPKFTHRDRPHVYAQIGEDVLAVNDLYAYTKSEEDLEKLKTALSSQDFRRYVDIVGKEMRGGWRRISGKDVGGFGIDIEKDTQ